MMYKIQIKRKNYFDYIKLQFIWWIRESGVKTNKQKTMLK